MKDSKLYNIKYNPISSSGQEITPCLVVFPLNYPQISSLSSSESEWLYTQNKEKKLRNDKYLSCTTPKIIFDSKNKCQTNRSDYVIGIINKKTKREITFYDIDSLFPMSQKVRKITEENKGIDVEDKNIGATKLELMSNFGTAKAQKMAINMRTNIVGEENIASANAAKQILKEFAENREQISMQEEAKKNQLETMKDILPAFDLKTNDVKKIFDFNSVVDRTVLLSWNVDHITEILMNKGVGLNDPKLGLCEYAIEFLKSISKNVMKGTDQSNKIRMVLYLNELIRFYLLPKIIKEDSEKLSKKTKIEKKHIEIMLNKYTKASAEGSDRVFYVKDTILILRNVFHILAISLLINNYEAEYSTLARSMKLETKVMSGYFREMGCTLKTVVGEGKKKNKGKMSIAVLKAPLKLNTGMKNFAKRK